MNCFLLNINRLFFEISTGIKYFLDIQIGSKGKLSQNKPFLLLITFFLLLLNPKRIFISFILKHLIICKLSINKGNPRPIFYMAMTFRNWIRLNSRKVTIWFAWSNTLIEINWINKKKSVNSKKKRRYK